MEKKIETTIVCRGLYWDFILLALSRECRNVLYQGYIGFILLFMG